MSWRGQGITGSNNIPLGSRRRGTGDEATPPTEDRAYNGGSPTNVDIRTKRGRSPVRGTFTSAGSYRPRTNHHVEEPSADGSRRRKKRNRWGDATDNKAAGLMGLTTAITANMTAEQLDAYTLHLRIEEISQKLRINDVVPADGDR